MSDAWAVVAAGLGGSALTGLAALGLEWYHSKRAEGAERRNRLREACADLNAHAIAIALRASLLTAAAASQTGLSFTLQAMFHSTKPLDAITVGEWLMAEEGGLLKALAVIEVLGDGELIQAGAEVIGAAHTVLEVSGELESYRREDLKKAQEQRPLTGWAALLAQQSISPEQEEDMQRRARELFCAARRFASLIRAKLDIAVPDAVIEAYSALLGDQHEEPSG